MYGILITSGIFVAATAAEKIAKNKRMNLDILWGSLFVGLIFGVAGARLYHVLDYWKYYSENIRQIAYIWQGGLGIWGGIFGGTLGIIGYLKIHKQSVLAWTDLGALFLPLGQSIGRLGNYFNGELLPYALYESALDFVLFLVLLLTYKKKSDGTGLTTFGYFAGYSIIRLAIGTFHTDSWDFWGIDIARVISAVVLSSSLYKIRRLWNGQK